MPPESYIAVLPENDILPWTQELVDQLPGVPVTLPDDGPRVGEIKSAILEEGRAVVIYNADLPEGMTGSISVDVHFKPEAGITRIWFLPTLLPRDDAEDHHMA